MFAECAASVLAQTFTDWTWWVVINEWTWPIRYSNIDSWDTIFNDPRIVTLWFPTDTHLREEVHVPARIVNWLYPKVITPYIYFLADDDLIDPDGLDVLVEAASSEDWDTHNVWAKHNAVYGRCEVVDEQPDGSYTHATWCYEHGDVGLDTAIDPHCLLDGGQVLHTKALWDRAVADGWQLSDALDHAPANDGLLLSRLAKFARFHYVPQRIVTHRRHAGATHHRPVNP